MLPKPSQADRIVVVLRQQADFKFGLWPDKYDDGNASQHRTKGGPPSQIPVAPIFPIPGLETRDFSFQESGKQIT